MATLSPNAALEALNEAEVFQVLKNVWLQVLMEFNLTPATLALIMITTILIISAVFAFIFIGFGIFADESNVSAVANSILTLATGGAVSEQSVQQASPKTMLNKSKLIFQRLRSILLKPQFRFLLFFSSVIHRREPEREDSFP